MSQLPDIMRVKEIARKAGEIILPFFSAGSKVTYKEDNSPVTEADLASHEYICGELIRLAPGIPIVSEEGVNEMTTAGAPFWLVDPLDGTREFLENRGEFTVNIGLILQDTPILGVVHVPVARETYYASNGSGAYKDLSDARTRLIRTRQTQPDKLTCLASRHHGGPAEEALRRTWPAATVCHLGSAWKLCRLAEGEADFYYRITRCMAWDTAAADCVLREAGGALCTLDGKALSYHRHQLENPPFVAMGDPQFDWSALVRPPVYQSS